jgi:hypothetical protein
MEPTITKVLKVADKAERLALKPKQGHMAVQKDIHERFFFDGYRWRMWKPGTNRHWKDSGKPKPMPVKENIQIEDVDNAKKKKLNPYFIAGVIALAIIIILLINVL